MLGHLTGSRQVGRTFQPYCERVQLGPPCRILAVGLHTSCGIFLRHRRYYRRVQAARKQNPIRNIGHKLLPDRVFESPPQFAYIRYVILHVVIRRPVAFVPTGEFSVAARPVVAWQKRLYRHANAFQRFEFGSEIELLLDIPAYVQRNDAHMVAGDEIFVLLGIVKRESENTAQVLYKIHAVYSPSNCRRISL